MPCCAAPSRSEGPQLHLLPRHCSLPQTRADESTQHTRLPLPSPPLPPSPAEKSAHSHGLGEVLEEDPSLQPPQTRVSFAKGRSSPDTINSTTLCCSASLREPVKLQRHRILKSVLPDTHLHGVPDTPPETIQLSNMAGGYMEVSSGVCCAALECDISRITRSSY